MGPNRRLPCLGPAADLGGNVGGRQLYDRAYSVAELFFELAVRQAFEPSGFLVHAEYGFAGNLTGHWKADLRVIHAGQHPVVAEIHEAIVFGEKITRNPTVGKADFLLIPKDGRRCCGVIEVGTRRGRGAKLTQVSDRVTRLRSAMQRAQALGKCKGVEWRAEPWRPNWPPGTRASDPFGPEGYYICAEPTWREIAPPGVLLYEVHRLLRDRQGANIPLAPMHFQPLASQMSRWLHIRSGDPCVTLNSEKPTVLGHAAVSSVSLKAEMRRQVMLFGAGAVIAGVTALLLAEMPVVNVVLIAATYKFVEAAAAAAATADREI